MQHAAGAARFPSRRPAAAWAGVRALAGVLAGALACALAGLAPAQGLPEYRLKAAFLYNFALFTEWPAEVGGTLTLCIVGNDPFGKEIDALDGKAVGARALAVRRPPANAALVGCQIVYVAPAAQAALPRLLDGLHGAAVLAVADSPGALRQGAALNMAVDRDKVVFEANLQAARAGRVTLSSKLLRLATEVLP